jgi:4'-phosphopantetheinyl transferase
VHLQAGPQGKPFVAGGPAFNLTHSEGLGLCAIARGRDAVGVDVEALRAVPEAELIAERWIGREAAASLAAAAGADRDLAFLRLWTRRESVLKGIGIGLAAAEELDPREVARWSVVDLEPGTGYVGALALALARADGEGSRGAGA